MADNKYELVDKEYKASVDFKVKDKKTTNSTTSNPITLDNIYKFIIIFVIAIVGVIVGIIVKRKSTSK